MKHLFVITLLLMNIIFSPLSYALPPSVKLDMLKTKLVEQLKTNDYSAALQTMQELKDTSMKLPASFGYFEAKALFETGQKYEAYKQLEKYVVKNGKDAKYYNQAIVYLVKAEDTYNAEKKKKEQERITREQAEQAKHEKETLLRKEADDFSTLPQTESCPTGLLWTKPVPEKYRTNPFLPVKFHGTANEAQTYCENLTLDGCNDWKLPTLKEFSTITGKGSKFSFVDWGGKPYYSVWVWGSSEFSKGDNIFNENQIYEIRNGKAYALNNAQASIMCVRIASQEAFADYFQPKYQEIEINGHKIMMEDRYMISNKQCYFVDPNLNFDQAHKYCKSLTLGGYDDWRVPTKKDMLTKIPCHLENHLRFLRNDLSYSEIWHGNISLTFYQGIGYLQTDECSIRSAETEDHHRVRCIRDIEENSTETTQKNTSSSLEVDGH